MRRASVLIVMLLACLSARADIVLLKDGSWVRGFKVMTDDNGRVAVATLKGKNVVLEPEQVLTVVEDDYLDGTMKQTLRRQQQQVRHLEQTRELADRMSDLTNASLRGRVKKTETAPAAKTAEAKKLAAGLAQSTARCKKLEGTVASQAATLAENSKTIASLQETVKARSTKLAATEKSLAERTTACETLRKTLDDTTAALETRTAEAEALTTRLADTRRELAKSEVDLKAMGETVETLKGIRTDLEGKLTRAEALAASRQQAVETLQGQLRSAKQVNDKNAIELEAQAEK
ncbi:MAG: hypothetical protein ACOCXX_02205, partial [Planctomycetota bacterium]